MWIETTTGDFINLDFVKRATPVKRAESGMGYRLFDVNDTVLGMCSLYSLDELIGANVPAIPSLPGFAALTYHFDDAGDHVDEQPIVGWSVGRYGLVALTPDTVDTELAAILYPDGRVVSPEDEEWNTRDVWLFRMREKHGHKDVK